MARKTASIDTPEEKTMTPEERLAYLEALVDFWQHTYQWPDLPVAAPAPTTDAIPPADVPN